VLEEMPAFPERESSILAKLKKKPWTGDAAAAGPSSKAQNDTSKLNHVNNDRVSRLVSHATNPMGLRH
jgi:hypothetical protein